MTLSTRQIRLIAAFAGLNVLLVVVGWMALVSPQRHDAATAAAQAQLAQSAARRRSSAGARRADKQPAIHTAVPLHARHGASVAGGSARPPLRAQPGREGVRRRRPGISPQAAQATAPVTPPADQHHPQRRYFKVTGFLRQPPDARLRPSRAPDCARPALRRHVGRAEPGCEGPRGARDGLGLRPTTTASPQVRRAPVSTTATDTTTTTGG